MGVWFPRHQWWLGSRSILGERLSLQVDLSVGISRFGFIKRVCSHFIACHVFQLRIVHIFRQMLDETLVSRQVDYLFADGAFSPTAPLFGHTTIPPVTYLGVWFIDVTAVQALFVGVTDGFDMEAPSLQMVVVALYGLQRIVRDNQQTRIRVGN